MTKTPIVKFYLTLLITHILVFKLKLLHYTCITLQLTKHQ